MNYYLASQIMQTKTFLKNFETACQMGALKDDGKIDKEEEKTLKHIHKAINAFNKEIDKI